MSIPAIFLLEGKGREWPIGFFETIGIIDVFDVEAKGVLHEIR